MIRFDTYGNFTDKKNWNVLILTDYHKKGRGFIGGTLAGDFLYLAPFETELHVYNSLFFRIDIKNNNIWK